MLVVSPVKDQPLLPLLPMVEPFERPLRGSLERTHVVLDHHRHAPWIDSVVFVSQEISEPTEVGPRNRWTQLWSGYEMWTARACAKPTGFPMWKSGSKQGPSLPT